MRVNAHLIQRRFLDSVASLIGPNQAKVPFSIPLNRSSGPFRQRMMFCPRKSCVPLVAICLSLTWTLVVFSQEIDEGEFSRKTLGYKLQLLKNQFEQTEMTLLTGSATASRVKKLRQVYKKIKCLESEFRFGQYYPDLFDEDIFVVREELQLILADSAQGMSISEPGFLLRCD